MPRFKHDSQVDFNGHGGGQPTVGWSPPGARSGSCFTRSRVSQRRNSPKLRLLARSTTMRIGNHPRAIAADEERSNQSHHTSCCELRRAESRCTVPAMSPIHRELPSVPPESQLSAPGSEGESTDSSTMVRGTEHVCRGANSRSSLRRNAFRRPSHNRRNSPRHALARTRRKPATPGLPPLHGAQNSARIAGS